MKIDSTKLNRFVQRVLVNLPDSWEQRRDELEVLAALLPPKSDAILPVYMMLSGMNQAELAQKEFCFTGKPNSNHNGGK